MGEGECEHNDQCEKRRSMTLKSPIRCLRLVFPLPSRGEDTAFAACASTCIKVGQALPLRCVFRPPIAFLRPCPLLLPSPRATQT